MIHHITTKDQLLEAVDYLCSHSRISHDCESKGPSNIGGLFPFHGSRSFAHIFATDKDEFYFDFKKIPSVHKKLLQPIFNDEKRLIFYVNALFDNTIMHVEGLKNHARIADCPSLARVEYNEHGREEESYLSLEYLAKHYGVQLKIDAVKKYIAENNLYSPELSIMDGGKIPLYEQVPDEIMIPYACGDARSTFDLGTKIIQAINAKDARYAAYRDGMPPLIEVAQAEIKLTSALLDARIEGMTIDRPYIENQIAEEQKEINNLEVSLKEIVGDINLNSSKQLSEFLLSKGIELEKKKPTKKALQNQRKYTLELKEAIEKKFTPKKIEAIRKKLENSKKVNYCTDKKAIARIYKANPEFEFLMKYVSKKEAEKRISTYYSNFLMYVDKNDIVHAQLNQETTITGRMSGSNPNLQNLHKKDKKVKRSFKCLDKDFNWFYIDFKQQEMIVMLDQSEEMQIIYKLIDGIFDDFYEATRETLLELAGIEITRQEAKTIALGLAYGQGDELLAENLDMPLKKAKEFKAAFFRVLPNLEKLKERLEQNVIRRGRIHNPFGRVSYIDREGVYKALNSFIQGTSADITKRAVIALHEFLKPHKSKFLLVIHDEVIFKIHKTERYLIPQIQKIMSEAYPHKHIPLGSDVEWSDDNESWADKKPYIPEAA